MSSVLEKKIFEPDRPFSRKELQEKRKQIFRNMHIGNTLIQQSDCRHVYFAKSNGKKEKEAKEMPAGTAISGNCSVCWKINRTPKNLKNRAIDLVEAYTNSGSIWDSNSSYNYYDFELETDFYTWLYQEFNPKKE